MSTNYDDGYRVRDDSERQRGPNDGGDRAAKTYTFRNGQKENKKACNGRCTVLEVVLLVLLCLLIIGMAVLAMFLAREKDCSQNGTLTGAAAAKFDGEKCVTADSKNVVCITKECVSAAAQIRSSISETISPCENFYEFACGQWLKDNVVPDDSPVFSTNTMQQNHQNILLKGLLDTEGENSNLESVKQARKFYNSCMDETKIHDETDNELKRFLNELGGWPLIKESWDEKAANLTRLLTNMTFTGNPYFFKLWVGPDWKNANRNIIHIDQPYIWISKYVKANMSKNDEFELFSMYRTFIDTTASSLQNDDSFKHLKDQITELIIFELDLIKILRPNEQVNDQYNSMSLSQFYTFTGDCSFDECRRQTIDWRQYFSAVTSSHGVSLGVLPDNEPIIIRTPAYFKSIQSLLAQTSARTQVNYLMWRLIQDFVFERALGKKYEANLVTSQEILFDASVLQSRFSHCVWMTSIYMGPALGKLYVQHKYKEDNSDLIRQMTDKIKDSFYESLDDVYYLDKDSLKAYKKKVKNMGVNIGYSKEHYNNQDLEKEYHDKMMVKFISNLFLLKREYVIRQLNTLRKTVDRAVWPLDAQAIHTSYRYVENELTLPAGFLQPPMFSPSYPAYLNFGSLGVATAKAVSKSFDDIGLHFDEHQLVSLQRTNQQKQALASRLQCFTNQFMKLSKQKTQPNMALVNDIVLESGSLRQAMKAYKKWVHEHSKDTIMLPGLKYHHEQLFFIGFAQRRCEKLNEKAEKRLTDMNYFYPEKIRVNGAVQNSPEFAEAFNCQKNSPMNPQDKCNAW